MKGTGGILLKTLDYHKPMPMIIYMSMRYMMDSHYLRPGKIGPALEPRGATAGSMK